MHCTTFLAAVLQNPRLAKEYRPKFARVNRIGGVVEYIVTASRYRIFVPQLDCMISFVLAGIRAPNVARTSPTPIPGEPYGDEALRFARSVTLACSRCRTRFLPSPQHAIHES